MSGMPRNAADTLGLIGHISTLQRVLKQERLEIAIKDKCYKLIKTFSVRPALLRKDNTLDRRVSTQSLDNSDKVTLTLKLWNWLDNLRLSYFNAILEPGDKVCQSSGHPSILSHCRVTVLF